MRVRRTRSPSTSTRPSRPSTSSAVSGYAVAHPQRQLQALDTSRLVVEVLPRRLGRLSVAHRCDVPLGRSHVPPSMAVTVRVGRRTEAAIVALLPVEDVVPTLVAGHRPVADLVVRRVQRRSAGRRPIRTCRRDRRRRDDVMDRRPTVCRPRSSTRTRTHAADRARGRRRALPASRRGSRPLPHR